jgi:ABC-2 type transport system ATP-binding protein
MTPLLEVRQLTRKFGSLLAVNEASFTIQKGEVWGFIGPNGAGKTTTMRAIATLDLPDEGDVYINGSSVLVEPQKARQTVGFMPDSLGAYSDTTVLEYLDFFARAVGLEPAARKKRIDQVMDFTDLRPLAERMMKSLSKGMSQRLCLAKTLLHDPELLVLDEPAAGLDPRARVEFRELVRALANEGKGVLISSHILSELSEVCDGVVVIEQGKIIRAGGVKQLAKDVSEYELLFIRTLGSIDKLETTLAESRGVVSTRQEREGLVIEFQGSEEEISDLLASLVNQGLKPVEFHWHQVDLEELFLSFTDGNVQ